MKKRYFVILAAALLLSGCHAKTVVKKTITAVGNEVVSQIQEKKEKKAEVKKEEKTEEQAKEQAEEQTEEKLSQLQIGFTYNYEGEWDEDAHFVFIKAESDNIHVINDGYDALKQSLDQWNNENFQEILSYYNENISIAHEAIPVMGGSEGWMLKRNIDVVRADSQILSFWNEHTDYLGGAHGGYYLRGMNFNPETGEQLVLKDVVTDYDKFYEAFMNELKETSDPEYFFPEWEDTVKEMFFSEKEENGSRPEWTMDHKGITIVLNPYTVASWAAGRLNIRVDMEEYPELFGSQYKEENVGNVTQVYTWVPFCLSDGKEILFHCVPEEDSFDNQIEIQKNIGDSTLTLNTNVHGDFSQAYMVETADGKTYLYAEFISENDYSDIEVFDLGENFRYVGNAEASLFGAPMTSTEEFALYNRLHFLGTYNVYRIYRIGEDGLPVTDDQDYRILNMSDYLVYELKTKQELRVKIEGKEEVIPAGTGMRIQQTDGKSYAFMRLSDGRVCELSVSRAENQYELLINGISEYDCFEMLPYAG